MLPSQADENASNDYFEYQKESAKFKQFSATQKSQMGENIFKFDSPNNGRAIYLSEEKN